MSPMLDWYRNAYTTAPALGALVGLAGPANPLGATRLLALLTVVIVVVGMLPRWRQLQIGGFFREYRGTASARFVGVSLACLFFGSLAVATVALRVLEEGRLDLVITSMPVLLPVVIGIELRGRAREHLRTLAWPVCRSRQS